MCWTYPVLAGGQVPVVKLYSDSLFSDTTIVDTSSCILKVYVVIENYPGVTATQFKIEGSTGFTGSWLGETVQVGLCRGTSVSGIEIGFYTCLHPPLHILTITYSMVGTSESGSYLQVVPGPSIPIIMVCDCSQTTCLIPIEAEGGRLYTNVGIVPIQHTTWGRVKHLFGSYDE